MGKPRIIIADTDINYIIPLQLKFVEDFFDKVNLEIISDENYFTDFLKCLFNSAQCDSMSEIISLLKDFYSDDINLKLELGYYREFNAASKFLIKPFPGSFRVFTAEHFDPKNIDYIDIKFNEALLRDLYKIYFSIYNS